MPDRRAVTAQPSVVGKPVWKRVLLKLSGEVLAGQNQFGIDPVIDPLPETQHESSAIVAELRALHENDLIGRLRIGGFTNYGDGEDTQRCEECIHYHSNRRWCDLPELPMPVDAHWWCRLWKS